MKHKVGDIVTIKSKEWYDANKNVFDKVKCGYLYFVEGMSKYRGEKAIVEEVNDYYYRLNLDKHEWRWTDEMFE